MGRGKGARCGIVALIATALVAAAGCGGGSKSDNDKIREVVKLFAGSDPAVCSKVTDRYLKDTFKTKETCEKEAKTAKSEKSTIYKIKRSGNKATVDAKIGDTKGTFTLLKEDGDWKVDKTERTPAESSSGGGGNADETAARGTVDAFFQSIKDKDGEVFCGLLSDRYAKEIFHAKGRFPIAECVSAASRFNWSSLQKDVAGVSVSSVNALSDTAEARLSDGEVIHLKKKGSRWVIDDISRS